MIGRGLALLLLSGVVSCNKPLGAQTGSAVGNATLCGSANCELACDRGVVQACTRAAELYWEGKSGHAFDPEKSFRFATRGCDRGDGLACALLGEHHEKGIGTEWAPALAVASYEKSCVAGGGLGCLRLATMYDRGHGVDIDRVKAEDYKRRAYAVLLATCRGTEPRWCTYAASLGTDRTLGEVITDDATSVEFRQRACDHGVGSDCVQLLATQLPRGTEQRVSAVHQIDKLCRDGEPSACSTLARLEQRNAADDRTAARRSFELAKRACDVGDARSCMYTGLLYEAGEVVPKDSAAKRRYVSLACARGIAEACLYLAEESYEENGLGQDVASWALRGCQMGNREACGLLLSWHVEMREDAAAIRWATEACRLGSWLGCTHLVEHDADLPALYNDAKATLLREACEKNNRTACHKLGEVERADEVVARAVLDAVTRQDAAALGKLLPGTAHVHGLWFESQDCRKQFSGLNVVLTRKQHPAFLRCLGSLDLRVELHRGLSKTPALVYQPGVMLDLDVRQGIIESFWTDSPRIEDASAVPIASELFSSHLVAGTHDVEPDQQVVSSLAQATFDVAYVDFRICVDPTGKPNDIKVLTSSQKYDTYVRAAEAAVGAWRFKPFLAHGKAIGACALDRFVYPADRRNRLPMLGWGNMGPLNVGGREIDVPSNVVPTTLDANRITGSKYIYPDDKTKTAIYVAGRSKLVGTFKLCISSTGRVSKVSVLKSTGFEDYDLKIEHGIRRWRYTPFMLDGIPQPICSTATFIYTQR